MSVTTTAAADSYTGDSSTVDFVFNFPLPGATLATALTSLYVYLDGVVQTYTTNYTVAYTLRNNNGTVTFATSPTTGVVVRLELHPPYTQELSLTEGASLPSSDLTDAYDKLTLALQYLDSKAVKIADGLSNVGTGGMATQSPSAVAITGGSITGITDLTVADGGTGASTASDARTNLGLGTIATQNASAVTITGGSLSGMNTSVFIGNVTAPNFIGNLVGNATTANGLNSSTTTIVVNTSTAPTTGQILTATSGTSANWQTPATMTATVGGLVPTPPNDATQYLSGTGVFSVPTGGSAYDPFFVVLDSNNTLASTPSAQPLFDGGGGPAGGQITLPVGLYEFECQFALSAMSATSGSFGFALGGGATFTQAWTAHSKDGTLATAASGQLTYNTAANTTLCTASTATVGSSTITGIIRVTVGGTIIPQVSLTTAAAAVVAVNSFFKIIPLSSTSTTVTVGNWS